MKIFLCVLTVGLPFLMAQTVNSDEVKNEIDDLTIDLGYLGSSIYGKPSKETGKRVAAWKKGSAQNPEELGEYAEGDILHLRKDRIGMRFTSRWRDGIIPFDFSPDYSFEDKLIISRVIAEFTNLTCLKFTPKISSDTNYVQFTMENSGCWSSVGQVGGKQNINLQYPNCWMGVGTIEHEMLHAVGVLHEQTRPNRDEYITVHDENIDKDAISNFNKYSEVLVNDFGVSYDYGSVMHYSRKAFSTNGKDTIVPKKPDVVIGQRVGMSIKDLEKVNKMYKFNWTEFRSKTIDMKLFLCLLAVGVPLVLAQPVNFRAEADENELDGAEAGEDDLYSELVHLGASIFGTPDKKSGEKVSTWKEGSAYNPEELGEYAEGDILHPIGEGRNGLKATSSRWPKGIIPYEISPYFSSSDRQMIMSAIEDYKKLTCLRFTPRTSGDRDYVYFTNGNTGCWSSVGKIGGRQEVNLQSPGCLTKKGTVMHEMLHAAGFMHEQNRPDRDKYVTVNYNNIQSGRENNFEKAQSSMIDDQGVGYDYRSVMHYSSNAFSKNGQATIDPKTRGVTMGQRDGLSRKDVQKIQKMYKCKSKRQHTSSSSDD
ncbi:uncharacterized protein LOC126841740 [Adelges cooleyi]|uniref:uncharacterized protein LOC126841740 n=1 Tax=Adelges cooleyi TaxID=133065 RepID=UPI00217FA086|nr:uncharacterized protein LOC126841740 [Adelges cooleyi]